MLTTGLELVLLCPFPSKLMQPIILYGMICGRAVEVLNTRMKWLVYTYAMQALILMQLLSGPVPVDEEPGSSY